MPQQPGFPAFEASDKKFNSRPVAPTVFRKKPFGENVEGLFCLNDRLFSHVEPSSNLFDLEQGIFARPA